ncbi:NUMOD4 motif-containing HNH endonuclease [Mesorhizobium sp. M0184]|uniref:NUMOD4 motif-containing HNH endonuclease n=1 Tax=Mesorhizobium sp. M0184 TaxID=2956906 RepID=UPI00333A93E5
METWTDIIGFEGYYQVSDHGRVMSLARKIWVSPSVRSARGYYRTVKARTLRPARSFENGRLCALNITLWRDHIAKCELVHTLVLENFVGPRPEGKYGCHKDDRPANNRLDNLYWGTPTENCADKIRNGKQPRGTQIPWAKLTEQDVLYIRTNACNTSQSELATKFGVRQPQISRVVNRHEWQHI